MTKADILIAYKEGKYDIFETLNLLNNMDENDSCHEHSETNDKRSILENMIYKNILTPLSTVAHHHDIECIERYFSDKFPAHLAIHRVNDAKEQKRVYTELHTHNEQEINIIVGDKEVELVYEVQLEDEVFEVKSNASIWIPSGVKHACNVIKGSGYYIALRLNHDIAMVEKFIHNFNL